MRKFLSTVAVAGCFLLLAGCFTVHHSQYPEVAMSSLPEGSRLSVQLAGFEAVLTSYVPVYGYETVYRHHPSFYHRGRYHSGFYGTETYSTTSFVPQTQRTTAFIERAQEALEYAGFKVNATNSRYRVEVRFSGPVVTDGDRTAEVLWSVLSLLSADYGAQTWSAKLKIYDAATEDLVMHSEYVEKCSAAVWGPLPILSPAGSSQTDGNTMQCWALSALTDRAMADATAFLVSKAK